LIAHVKVNEEEPKWLLEKFLSNVNQDASETEQIHSLSQNFTDSKKENVDIDNLDQETEKTVSVLSKVTSSVTSITNTIFSETDDEDIEVDEDGFEIVAVFDI